jgi:predicted RNA-binding protein Jag
MNEWKEFIGDTVDVARAAAARHFALPEQQLDVRVVSEKLTVSGLGARVLILATEREEGDAELSDLGEILQELVELLTGGDAPRIREQAQDDQIKLEVGSPGLERIVRRERGALEALAHLVERIFEKETGEPQRVRVELLGSGRERGGRDGRRGDRGGRGGDRGGRRDGRGGGRARGDARGDDRQRRDARGGDRGPRESGGGRGRGGPGERPSARSSDADDAELEQWVHRVAEEVRTAGEPRILRPMTSRERWVVHNTVKDIAGVTSESVGEGDAKRVKLIPD